MSSSLVEGTDCPVCKTRMDHLSRTCNLIGCVISILHPGKGNADEGEYSTFKVVYIYELLGHSTP